MFAKMIQKYHDYKLNRNLRKIHKNGPGRPSDLKDIKLPKREIVGFQAGPNGFEPQFA